MAVLWLRSAFERNRLLIRGSVIKCACVSQIILTRVTRPAKKKRRVRVVLLHTTNILTNIHTNIQLTYILTNILTNILKRVCGPRQAYRPGESGAGLWGAADFCPQISPGKNSPGGVWG